MDHEKEVKIMVRRINRNNRQNFSDTVLERLSSITEIDIATAKLELEEKNLIKAGELFIGNLNQREKRVVALICKLKKELVSELVQKNLPNTDRSNWDLSNKLSRDIKFLKLWLAYLIKSRFNLPENFGFDFRKGFMAIGWHKEQRFDVDDDY
ncbi:MAG: hypothetical protein ACOYL8_03590 [Patescibacteria group bacterium]